MSKRRRTSDEPIDSSKVIQQTFDEMMAEQGGKKRRDKKRTNLSAILAHSRSRPPGTRLDVDPAPAITKPSIPVSMRTRLGVQSPTSSPRLRTTFIPPRPKPSKKALAAARPAGFSAIPSLRRPPQVPGRTLAHRGKYPGHIDDPSRIDPVAKKTFKEHGVDWVVPQPLFDKMKNTLSTKGHSLREIDEIIRVAKANYIKRRERSTAPDLEAQSVTGAISEPLEEGELKEEDSPRTKPPPPRPATPPGLPEREMMIDLEEETPHAEDMPTSEIRPAATTHTPSEVVIERQRGTDVDTVTEYAHRDEDVPLSEISIPQSTEEQLHARLWEAKELPGLPTPSQSPTLSPSREYTDYNPDNEDIATSESIFSETMSRATSYRGHYPEAASSISTMADHFGGIAGDREAAQLEIPEEQDINVRQNYMNRVYARRPTFLRTANKQAVTYSNNPIKQSMSMNFGSMLSRDRKIQLRSGSILASRGKTVIKCSKKTPADVHAINGFLQTEYPYGAKVGGSKYSLVALIPKVLKSLPGTVTLSV